MLNDARVASTWLYVRTCQRVRNIKNITTIRDFQLYIRVNSTTIKNLEKNTDVVIFTIPLLNRLCTTFIIQGGQKYMFQHIAYII